MVLGLFFWCLSTLDERGDALPDLEKLFLEKDRTAFARLLAHDYPVTVELRPLLNDFGYLSRQQVLMGFDKLRQRFRVRDARVVNSQSDTNYAWLEIYLHLNLEDKRTGRAYETIFAFHFKITASRMAISRWVLQDVH